MRRKALLLLLVAAALLLAWQLLREPLEVDACLDSGGSYDYEAGNCDYAVNRPARPDQ